MLVLRRHRDRVEDGRAIYPRRVVIGKKFRSSFRRDIHSSRRRSARCRFIHPTADISLEGPTLTADAVRRNVKRLYKPFMIMINVTQTPQGRRKTDVLDG